MSRTGSFPLRVAFDLIDRHASSASIILDPFCGKGTVLLAARALGKRAYGIDVAPEAVVCSAAKMLDISLDQVLDYLHRMNIRSAKDIRIPGSVRVFYHRETLRQMIGVREELFRDLNGSHAGRRTCATFVLAAMLGILHGHASYSLSLPCAHAFSMSPEYAGKYATLHNLAPSLKDVRHCLVTKVSRCLVESLPKPVVSEVKSGSAAHCTSVFPRLVGKVDAIVTSPPYLNAQTYAKDNWLRLWFLGHDYRALRPNYIETGSLQRYAEKMAVVFQSLSRMLRYGGALICVAGDVRRSDTKRGKRMVKTGAILAGLCRDPEFGLRVVHSEWHKVSSSSRYFHSLVNTNGHSKRDITERVFVATKRLRNSRGL